MSSVDEIRKLEDELRQAELGPDPAFYERYLHDDAVMIFDGNPAKPKKMIVEAHRPGKQPKFTDVQMSDVDMVDHGNAVIVTCRGAFSAGDQTHRLKFMRVWLKTELGWRIVAGTVSADE